MKKLYAEQKHTIYEIGKNLNIKLSLLYWYCGNKKAIENIKLSMLEKIAVFEGIDPIELKRRMLEYVENENDRK